MTASFEPAAALSPARPETVPSTGVHARAAAMLVVVRSSAGALAPMLTTRSAAPIVEPDSAFGVETSVEANVGTATSVFGVEPIVEALLREVDRAPEEEDRRLPEPALAIAASLYFQAFARFGPSKRNRSNSHRSASPLFLRSATNMPTAPAEPTRVGSVVASSAATRLAEPRSPLDDPHAVPTAIARPDANVGGRRAHHQILGAPAGAPRNRPLFHAGRDRRSRGRRRRGCIVAPARPVFLRGGRAAATYPAEDP